MKRIILILTAAGLFAGCSTFRPYTEVPLPSGQVIKSYGGILFTRSQTVDVTIDGTDNSATVAINSEEKADAQAEAIKAVKDGMLSAFVSGANSVIAGAKAATP